MTMAATPAPIPAQAPVPASGRGPAASKRQPSVRIADQVLSRGLAESDASLWQRSLQGAYVAGLVPECLCSPAPVPMYIARLGDTYVLKRRPKTGHLHHADCESHGGISDAAFRLYTAEAISERPDGKVAHTLSVPLTTVEHVNPEHTLDEVAAPPRPDTAARRPTMTLRGFMNLLWEEAGLCNWSPGMLGKRTLGLVYWRLREALVDRVIAGLDAQQRVYVPRTHAGPEADVQTRREIGQRLDALDESAGANHRPILLILAELRSIIPTQRNAAVRLKGLPDDMPIWTPPGSIERLRQQWPAAVDRFTRARGRPDQSGVSAPAANPNPRLMLLVGVQRSAQGNLQWRYGAALETTELWIPVDSGHEATVANLLVEQQRRFRKPLRYDGVAAMFPDFILTDLQPETPMEIYGFSGEAYEERKRQKMADYQKLGTPYWHWDLQASRRPPLFPTVHSTRSRGSDPAAPVT